MILLIASRYSLQISYSMSSIFLLDLMKRFRLAYGRADRSELLAVTSHDFEWHQHMSDSEDDSPNGHVLKGIDELLEELTRRGKQWQQTSYQGMQERVAGDDLLVQTFTISGIDSGTPFHAKVVDLYPVRNKLIIRKDTYWKYVR